MFLEVTKENYSLSFSNGKVVKGAFGEIKILETPIFYTEIKNMESGEIFLVSSAELCKKEENKTEFKYFTVLSVHDIDFEVSVLFDDFGANFDICVNNKSGIYSVMNITYPTPRFSAHCFNIFEPSTCGKVTENAGAGYENRGTYPATSQCMQYFAAYGSGSGIYLGAHDGKGAVKRIFINAGEGEGFIKVLYPAEGANTPGNSFKMPGIMKWQYFEGDWYDATMIYKDFILKNANWIPEIGKNGRIDTCDKYLEIPFWICDYVPNSEYQRENMPASISAGSDIYEKDYWYNAAIKLKNELGTPVAYHVYNWHHIPFNVEYPHFMPPKAGTCEGFKKLRSEDIYIMPYINAVSWETKDSLAGHSINFENTGIYGAVRDINGDVATCSYPQTTIEGKTALLAPMCSSYEKWHDIIYDVVREMENTLDINGIYFDEIAAHPPKECYCKGHNHPTGGGIHWVEGYNKMMAKIKKDRPEESFYFTESNGEAYMKNFDGFLTWMWVQNGEVPAFPAVYAGYVQMVGRCTLGKKKEDFEFFKFCTAKSLLYGQQIGWYKADVVYKKDWLAFLKKAVKIRYDLRHFFKTATLLPPLFVETDLPEKITFPAMHYTEDVHMPQILSAAWLSGDKNEVIVILVNLSENKGSYHIDLSRINKLFDTKTSVLQGSLDATEYKVLNFKKQES